MVIIQINGQDVIVPKDFGSSADELLEEIGWESEGAKEWQIYRDDGGRITSEDKCGEPMVISEGDEFVIIPKTVTGGG